jgi:sugar phosphate isomerase/epimerase
MRIVSLPHLANLTYTPPQIVALAAEAGFNAACVRLSPTMAGEKQHPMIGDTPMMRETLHRLADTGLRILDIEAIWLNPEIEPASFVGVFEAASRLGAVGIQLVGNDPDVGRATDNFARLCELAKPCGLTIDLEYMVFNAIGSLERTREIVEAAGQPNGGILLDALHFFRAGTSLDAIGALDPRCLHYFQLCDARGERPKTREALLHEARYDRQLPGTGEIDLVSLLDALPEGIPISAEVPLTAFHDGGSMVERAKRLRMAVARVLEKADAARAAPGVRM